MSPALATRSAVMSHLFNKGNPFRPLLKGPHPGLTRTILMWPSPQLRFPKTHIGRLGLGCRQTFSVGRAGANAPRRTNLPVMSTLRETSEQMLPNRGFLCLENLVNPPSAEAHETKVQAHRYRKISRPNSSLQSVILDSLRDHCPTFLLGGTSGTFIEIFPSYMPQVRNHRHLDPAGAHSFLHHCLG